MNAKHKHTAKYPPSTSKQAYKRGVHDLQVEEVNLQKHIIAHSDSILVLFEGRDNGGKG